ncbi:receptor-type tyrosine-protein phosphatase F-like [Rhopilema esculentum]|uniref:receptor-type tyrosine-protein phosphatase F-like n=1 Tax=Rhopilema esculentum TaxID=499914 RepID=UPI0031E385F3
MVVGKKDSKLDRSMAAQFILGFLVLASLLERNDAKKGTVEAKEMYTGVPGKNLTLTWTWTGHKMYDYASIYIPDKSSSKTAGAVILNKLWHIKYFPSNNSIAKYKLNIVNSTFNNLTELDTGTGSIISLNIRAVPRNLSRFEFIFRLQDNDAWAPVIEKKIIVRVAVLPTVKITMETGGTTDVPQGRVMTAICKATGFPLPKIEIRKDNSKLQVVQVSGNEVSLKLKSVTSNDAGRYSCYATNVAGTTRSDAVLSVTYIQMNIKSSTVIQSALGKAEDLNCPIDGYPPLTYKWYYPQCNKNSPVGWSKEITIQLDKETKFGNYCCIGQNNIGLKTATFMIKGEAIKPKKRSGINSGTTTKTGIMLPIAAFVILLWTAR